MQQVQTDVLVIGGGATGTGVLRDLAMRGLSALLVEKGDLTHGTTGRYHGLLHSGARYAVKDPQSARECIQENRVLRRIMPHCIEDTGGFFVLTEYDDPGYVPRFLDGCRRAGIPVEELSVGQMLRLESSLNPRITRCFRVPDGSADSFLAADLNAASARQYGAKILTYHRVTSLILSGRRVVGCICQDLLRDENVSIQAGLVVNAGGAWAGQVASMAGLSVNILPGKGTMVAMNHRLVNTVINRCKMPSDGDILVPAHTVAVIGTTDVKVEDPDHFAIEPWEVHLLLEEGEKIVPGFKELRMLRAWAGVRPLYQEGPAEDTREVTRAFVLLDHAARDGVEGLVTISGGKWTTYRLMAEKTVDLICRKLGVGKPCRTHLEQLPEPEARRTPSGRGGAAHSGHTPGARLAEIEQARSFGKLVCECELGTEDEVARAILEDSARSIDDIRRDVRVGMGPCQGGFCTYRVAGMLHQLRPLPVAETNLALRDFLQERWKGLLPILWGGQLRQERLDQLIYLSILNADHLPGQRSGPLTPVPYAASATTSKSAEPAQKGEPSHPEMMKQPLLLRTRDQAAEAGRPPPSLDVLVIGAGLAGLFAAYQAARRGRKVRLISSGWGSLYWQPGCIDVLGSDPLDRGRLLESPLIGIDRLRETNPDHPYLRAGVAVLRSALEDLQALCAAAGYPLHGSLERNWRLPTALGAPRPTCLTPETMLAGDLGQSDPVLVAGFQGFPDFYPEWITANLAEQGVPAQAVRLALPELTGRSFVNARTLADLFEKPEFVEKLGRLIQEQIVHLGGFKPKRVALPAVLGWDQALSIQKRLEALLGLPVFEIPTLPPSIPGIRLSRILVRAIESHAGQVWNGAPAVSADLSDPTGITVWSEAAARRKIHRSGLCILATGGILGGGLRAEYDGSLQETVFGLPTLAPATRDAWLQPEFLSPSGHPIFKAGLRLDAGFRPLGGDALPVHDNLYAIGGLLAGIDPLVERSLEGIALLGAQAVTGRI